MLTNLVIPVIDWTLRIVGTASVAIIAGFLLWWAFS